MTRVLVLGNSHAIALRSAFPAIAAEHPDFTPSFWGLPGAAFAKAAVGPDGLLGPDPLDRHSLRKADEWNATDRVDLRAFDRIFLIGLRYNQRLVFNLMRNLHPLDWGPPARAQGVSEMFLRAAIRSEIDTTLTAQIGRVPMDARFTLMPAPYPAAAVTVPDTGLYEPVTRAVAALPHAADLMALHDEELTGAHRAHGVGFVLQPDETRSHPFLTRNRFQQDPTRDARHMNADYGLIAFRALIDSAILSGSSAVQTATTATA